jgi:nucleoside-diphosphate-sugar epimerase
MKVFVAGATGALGRPLVRDLRARGHHVVGLTRTVAGRTALEAAGARAAVADALDGPGLRAAVVDAAPDAIVHALTALPPGGPRRYRDLEATNLLRRMGTANLLRAATAAGTRRVVATSMILGYGHTGGRTATEEWPLAAAGGHPALDAALAAIGSLERQVQAAQGSVEAGVLRLGLFYGPGTSTDQWARDLRRRMLPLPAGGPGILSWIHVDDAAAATVAALERPSPVSVCNIVDDEPASLGAVVRELAAIVGAPAPASIPLRLAKLVAPYAAGFATADVRVSNALAATALDWRPTYPSYRDGLRAR